MVAAKTAIVVVLAHVLPLANGAGDHDHDHGSSGTVAKDYASFLPDAGVCIEGVGYPLYRTAMLANKGSSAGTSHAMEAGMKGNKYALYMPNGDVKGKVMCMDGGHDDHAGHAHRLLMEGDSKCTCPPAMVPDAIDATKPIMLPRTAFCIEGYYPMYATEFDSNAASPKGTSHHHMHTASDGSVYKFFMPNGVPMIHDEGKKCDAKYDDKTGVLLTAAGAAQQSTTLIAAIVGGVVGGGLLVGIAIMAYKKIMAKGAAATSVKAKSATAASGV